MKFLPSALMVVFKSPHIITDLFSGFLRGLGGMMDLKWSLLRCLRDWWAMVSLTTSIGESLIYPQMAREGCSSVGHEVGVCKN